jgi:hypothetical protein
MKNVDFERPHIPNGKSVLDSLVEKIVENYFHAPFKIVSLPSYMCSKKLEIQTNEDEKRHGKEF